MAPPKWLPMAVAHKSRQLAAAPRAWSTRFQTKTKSPTGYWCLCFYIFVFVFICIIPYIMIIPIRKLLIETTRSRVAVGFHLASADWLPEDTRKKMLQLHEANLGQDGFLRVRSDKTRSRTLNIADCMDKLRCYISEATQPPPLEQQLIETIETRRLKLDRASADRLKMKKVNGDVSYCYS